MDAIHDSISSIAPGKENWSIVVKVVRLWTVTDMNRPNVKFSMEMVLMDDKGDKIPAYIRKSLIYRFDKELREGSVYAMSFFIVAPNGGSFRPARHGYKLNFQYETKVVAVDHNLVTCSIYSFVPFMQLEEYDADYLVDVIGLLTGVGTEREIDRNGVRTKMNVIALDSDGYKVECALFGNYVDELNCFLASGDNQYLVVIIQFAKVKTFQGKVSLQNAKICTKLIFNPDCAEARDLKKRLGETLESPIQMLSQLPDASKVNVLDEFTTVNPRKTIRQLKDNTENVSCIVWGRITSINETDEWWYSACICNKSVVPDSKMFYCEKCNKHVLTVVPRYRIKVTVHDGTGESTFVIFDRDAVTLLDKSCADMIELHENSENPLRVPKEIMDLVTKEMLFKVEIKSFVSSRFGQSYRVKKLCADPVILEKFKSFSTPLEDAIVGDVVPQDLMAKFSDFETDSQNDSVDPGLLNIGNKVDDQGNLDFGVLDGGLSQSFNMSHSALEETPINNGFADEGISQCFLSTQDLAEITPVKRVYKDEGDAYGSITKLLKKDIKIEKD